MQPGAFHSAMDASVRGAISVHGPASAGRRNDCARARRPVTVALYAGPDSATCARLRDRLLLVAASDRDSDEVAASGWQPTVVVSTPFSVKPTRSQHDPATAAVARAGPGRRGFELAELLGRTPPTGPPASSSSSQSLETDQSHSVDI